MCAVLVLIAEFTALIPDIFPELQTSESRKSVGGAEGVAGILWPLCFFLGYVCIFMFISGKCFYLL